MVKSPLKIPLEIDLMKIDSLRVWKRLFKIRDRNLPYELHITYYRPSVSYRSEGYTIIEVPRFYDEIKIRYGSEKDAEKEMNEILTKQKSILNCYRKQIEDLIKRIKDDKQSELIKL